MKNPTFTDYITAKTLQKRASEDNLREQRDCQVIREELLEHGIIEEFAF